MRPSAAFDREPKVRQLDALIGPRSRSHVIYNVRLRATLPLPRTWRQRTLALQDVATRDEDGTRERMRF